MKAMVYSCGAGRKPAGLDKRENRSATPNTQMNVNE